MKDEVELLPADKHKSFLQVFKSLLSLWVYLARQVQSNKNNQFAISLQYLKENQKDEVDFLPADKRFWRFFSNWYYHFRCVWPGTPNGKAFPKFPKHQVCNAFTISLEMKMTFLMQINIKASYQLISTLWASNFSTRL